MNMSKNVSSTEDLHSAKSEQTSEQNFKCKICYTGFQKMDSLKWHTTKEHNLELEDVEQMLKENSDGEDVLKDDQLEEGDTKKYKCEYCDNQYTKKNNVRRHKR